MIEKIADDLIGQMTEARLIDKEMEARYVYVFICWIEKFITVGSIIVISLMFHKLLPTIFFLVFFLELRKRTGGYHLDKGGTDMLKKIKKVIAFALALTMLMGMGTMVSAAEKESSIPEYSETNDGGMTVNIAGDQEGTIVEGSGNEEGINPLWWPGDGPAPQVTSISLYKYGWLTNGNFGVTIKVYGYGSDTTTFDGRSISWIHQEPFIISGTGADGFYYTYDCGPITQAGSYRFNTTFRSTNFPNTTRSFSTVFTFSAN